MLDLSVGRGTTRVFAEPEPVAIVLTGDVAVCRCGKRWLGLALGVGCALGCEVACDGAWVGWERGSLDDGCGEARAVMPRQLRAWALSLSRVALWGMRSAEMGT